jgi:hypothetical protein
VFDPVYPKQEMQAYIPAEEIAERASRDEDVSSFFTNQFTVVRLSIYSTEHMQQKIGLHLPSVEHN